MKGIGIMDIDLYPHDAVDPAEGSDFPDQTSERRFNQGFELIFEEEDRFNYLA